MTAEPTTTPPGAPPVCGAELDTLARLTAGLDMHRSSAAPALGVRELRLVDGPMGVASTRLDERDTALLAPSGTALAATWDTDTARRVGEILGEEFAHAGVDVVLGPNLNLTRSPLSGRSFEHFGEDPLLASALGAAWITGVQSRGVGTCAKHLVCNDSETDRHTYDVRVDDRTLHEVYLAPFEAAARAGAWAIMAAYNRVGGRYCAEHPELLTRELRERWGWDGVTVSDWFGTHTTRGALAAGLDLEMPGPARHLGPAAADAARTDPGLAQRLRESVSRLALLSRRTDRAAGPGKPTAPHATDGTRRPAAPPAGGEAGRRVTPAPDEARARRVLRSAAADSFVLLKNEDAALPLSPGPLRSLAVVGPNAAHPAYQGGSFARIPLRPGVRTPLDALREVYGHGVVRHATGVFPQHRVPAFSPLGPRPVDAPDARGFTVTYHRLDPDAGTAGRPLARDVRDTNLLVWFTSLPGIGALADLPAGPSGLVRASCLLTPDTTGTYDVHLAGTGDVRLYLDGKEAGRGGSRAEPEDVMGALLHGEVTHVPVELTAGREVRIDIEMRFGGGGKAQGLSFGASAPRPADAVERAVETARGADAALVCVGVTQDSALESADREHLALPAAQVELIERVCAVNARTVVVVNAPHPVDMPWADRASAVLMTWFPGQEYGPALAEVLAGDREPGGRLPLTIARRDADHGALDTRPAPDGTLRYDEGLFIGHRHFDTHRIAPRYAFGHGLGYADITWRSAHLRTPGPYGGAEPAPETVALVGARLACGPERGGKDVVQVYLSPREADGGPVAGRPEQQLAGFAAVRLAPGEEREVTVALDRRCFSWWDERSGAWRPRPGRWDIRVARSSRDVFHRFTAWLDTDGRLRPDPAEG
ncbi:glycoside hydrolase family 3 protein [Streptomyces mexicanus]|uniref:glycoside hydrolase family 3 protein n=1 Tax=Streptomyces mexicanus TaxID=178566 RepID=UPI0031EFB5A0